MSHALSNPSIMFKAQLRNGETIIIDDYREAYWWLRDNTPEDSRVMAWWDYGYQVRSGRALPFRRFRPPRSFSNERSS